MVEETRERLLRLLDTGPRDMVNILRHFKRERVGHVRYVRDYLKREGVIRFDAHDRRWSRVQGSR